MEPFLLLVNIVASIFMMSSRKVLHTFVEGMLNKSVIWYEDDYTAVRDGKNGHSGHVEIDTHFAIVRQAIETPDFVKQDRGYKNRKCYYLAFCGGRDFPNHHMKVVLVTNLFGRIKVLTAYFTDYFPQGETTIWTKS